jgi:hypothetical protein
MIRLESTQSKKFHEALVTKYKADMKKAEATLELYFNNTVGIGEHSDVMDDLEKWLSKYAEASEKLETMSKLFEEKV